MLNTKIEIALNNQLNAELYSSYLYLAMAAYFDEKNLSGFAHWMKVQSNEEYSHALKFYNYIFQRNGKVEFEAINSPKNKWKSILEVFENVYKHEQEVTKMIDDLVKLGNDEKDYATNNFLQWFVGEQVEEEATAYKIIENLKQIGESHSGIFLLDKELGSRK